MLTAIKTVGIGIVCSKDILNIGLLCKRQHQPVHPRARVCQPSAKKTLTLFTTVFTAVLHLIKNTAHPAAGLTAISTRLRSRGGQLRLQTIAALCQEASPSHNSACWFCTSDKTSRRFHINQRAVEVVVNGLYYLWTSVFKLCRDNYDRGICPTNLSCPEIRSCRFAINTHTHTHARTLHHRSTAHIITSSCYVMVLARSS